MLEFIVSKKMIEDRKIYRIHHLVEEQLVGLEAVEKMPDGKFRKIINWNDRGELEDYMNDLDDIVEVDEKEKKKVVDFLEKYPTIGKKELEEVLGDKEHPMTVVHYLSTPASQYALIVPEGVNHEEDGTLFRAYEVELNREGRLRGILPIHSDGDLEVVLGHMINNLENNRRVFFQFNEQFTVGIKRVNDEVTFLFIESYQNEDNEEQLTSSLERVHHVRHVKGSGMIDQQVEALTETQREAFIREMLSLLTNASPSEIIQQ